MSSWNLLQELTSIVENSEGRTLSFVVRGGHIVQLTEVSVGVDYVAGVGSSNGLFYYLRLDSIDVVEVTDSV